MLPRPLDDATTAVGIAYSGYTPRFLREHAEAVDYVEVPYELLAFDPSVIAVREHKPVVLHCASLSIAGSVPPSPKTLDSIGDWIEKTDTPWLGEHLSFISADRIEAGENADEYAPGEPYNLGYTVHPPMNDEALDAVTRSVERAQGRFDVPILLENPPLYFEAPGSRMSQTEFVREVVARCSANLLLDLAHFYITARNTGVDPLRELESYPLERVTEIHVSGVEEQGGGHWDNHSTQAPDVVFDLLAAALERAPARAITMEYNWSMRFPIEVLLSEIERTRAVLAAAG